MSFFSRFSRKRSGPSISEPAGVTLLRDGELGTRLQAVLVNATDHIQRERDLLSDGTRIPRLPGRMRGRPMVVVSREHDWQQDLASLKRWISDRDPVLIGVGKGAESLLDARYQPDVVIGSLDEISDLALNEAREVVVTAPSESSRSDQASADRFERAGVDAHWFIATGRSADLGLLLAEASDAPVVVTVGVANGIAERIAEPPNDAASSFVTRLRVDAHVVDAKAVAFLSSKAASIWPLVVLLIVGCIAVVAALAATPLGHEWWQDGVDWVRSVVARFST